MGARRRASRRGTLPWTSRRLPGAGVTYRSSSGRRRWAVAGPNLAPVAGVALQRYGIPTLAAPFVFSAVLLALAAAVLFAIASRTPASVGSGTISSWRLSNVNVVPLASPISRPLSEQVSDADR
ncbi:MAG: hypothetical protein ACREM1_00045 [Longimicrobiales bacterium]